jgi:hypothetical protein
MRQREPRHHEGGTNVHSDRLVEIGDRIILGHGVIEENPGIVYHDMELFEFPDREIDAFLRRVFFRDVGAERERFAAAVADRFRHVLDRIARQPAHNHARTFPRELVDNLFTDPGASTGHNRHFSL